MSEQDPPPDQPRPVPPRDPYGETPTEYQQPPVWSGSQPPAGGGYHPYPQEGPAEAGASRTDAKGFLGALFDFSFNNFVTPKIVKFVYVLATVALALFYLVLTISGFVSERPVVGVLLLVLGWIPFFLYLALIRMTLEFYFAIVRMSEDINKRLPR